MNESLSDAFQEVKRVDHLVFVSLKYTRTVDVIKSCVKRLISTLDFVLTAILEDLVEKKKITEIPASPAMKCNLVLDHLKDIPEIQEMVDFYSTLRRIDRAEYDKREEYRRHVTMIAKLDDTVIEVNIDLLNEYYEKIKGYLKFTRNLIEGKKNEY